MKKRLKIVFIGTPNFAAASLRILLEAKVKIVGVITAPDKPKGRGRKIAFSDVKNLALEYGLPVLQPNNLKDDSFLKELESYQADLQIVVAFRMLPKVVWNMPTLGTFNLHTSLLPQYRGAAPINWVIINGEKETGVTTFFLKHEIDTGHIIYQEKIPIQPNDNAGTLYERLKARGAELVLKTVKAIEVNNYPSVEQKEEEFLNLAPKIFQSDCEINWEQSAQQIKNFIRGLSPIPAAWSKLDDKTLKIYDAEIIEEKSQLPIGMFESDGKNYLRVNTKNGLVDITDLQIEGRKRMNIKDFLRGYKIKGG